MSQSRQMITLAPLQQHKSTLIFLHGLGDSGHGWSELGRSLQPAFVNTKFIFPHADSHPVTINGGYSMPSWYDIRGPLQSYHHNANGNSSNDDESSLKAENAREDLNGLERSRQKILNLIQQERQANPNAKLILGGFSQGGAVTYYTLLKSFNEVKIDAAVILSSYMPVPGHLLQQWGSKQKDTQTGGASTVPVFIAHGDSDVVVHYPYGQQSSELLKQKFGFTQSEFHTYRGMGHSSCDEEVSDFAQWLKKQVE
ncbi:hypothetical protein MP228_000597 [Amoeboaphelidium protococcarum]|nr:hypothetical protein MP228_000597 [Amoeboaphelidium protococcarum]